MLAKNRFKTADSKHILSVESKYWEISDWFFGFKFSARSALCRDCVKTYPQLKTICTKSFEG
jgi:hypothetical protein